MGFEEFDDSQLANLNIAGLNNFFSEQKQLQDQSFNQSLVSSLMTFFKKSYAKRKTHEELPIHDDQQGVLILFHKAIRFAVTVLALLMVFVIYLGVADVIYVMYEKLIN